MSETKSDRRTALQAEFRRRLRAARCCPHCGKYIEPQTVTPEVNYDETFYKGMEWLDAIGRGEIPEPGDDTDSD